MFDEDICKMEMRFVDGNEGELELVVTFWDGDEEDSNTYNMKYDKEEKQFESSSMFVPEDVWEVIRAKESMYLKNAEILKVGQKSVDGVIMKDREYPFVEKEKIDLLFEKCKHVYCDYSISDIYFTAAEEYRMDEEMLGQLENPLLLIGVPVRWKSMFEQKACDLEKMEVEIMEEGQKIIGWLYDRMPEQKYKSYFDSKVEELFLKMVEAYEKYQKRTRFQDLFKGK